MQKIYILSVVLAIFFTGSLMAQQSTTDSSLVQFSGLVLDGSNENLVPISYTNILVKGRARGTYTDLKGFFSIVVSKGDTVEFSAIGYKTVDYLIPYDLEDNRYSIVQLMTQDTLNLPETVIFPWPSREHFKLEFLAMDVTPELQEYAEENLAADIMAKARRELPYDGGENSSYYLKQQAKQNYYIGQRPPMNIFNAFAWKDFFQAWKRGDFKKKEEKK